jgi:endonuclease G
LFSSPILWYFTGLFREITRKDLPGRNSSTVNNRNLLLGNPSNAASSVASTDNYLMVKPQYVLSYNNKTHTANWVSWQLNKSWIGTADRKNDFRPDDALPNQGYFILVE